MDQRPKHVRVKTIKLLEENIENFMTLDLAMIPWIWHQEHKQQKQKEINWITSKF